MVPAELLFIDAEIAYRQSTLRDDWARSRPAPRTAMAAPSRGANGLRRRAARLLHA